MAIDNNFKIKHGLVVSTTATIMSTAQATSTNTGALQVIGGIGVGKNLYVGGTTFLAGDLYVDGTQFSVNSTNLVTGDRTIYLSTGSTSAIIATGSGLAIGAEGATYASFLFDGTAAFKSAASIVPATTSTYSLGSPALAWDTIYAKNAAISNLSGYIRASNAGILSGSATIPGSDISGAVSTATNLSGGLLGSIPYQSANGFTTFANIGTSGHILVSDGTVPYWIDPSSLVSSTATNSDNTFINAVTPSTIYYLGLTELISDYSPLDSDSVLFYDTTDSKLTSTKLAITSTATDAVSVSGGVQISGNLTVNNTAIVHDQTAITVGISSVVLDTFAVSAYRSAKYVISVSNRDLGEFQTSEILLVHNDAASYLNQTSIFSGSAPLMAFTTSISGVNVVLRGAGTSSGNTVKVQKIYITI